MTFLVNGCQKVHPSYRIVYKKDMILLLFIRLSSPLKSGKNINNTLAG